MSGSALPATATPSWSASASILLGVRGNLRLAGVMQSVRRLLRLAIVASSYSGFSSCRFSAIRRGRIPTDADALVSPADGTVTHVETIDEPDFGPALRVSIFLSIFNVHVNRAPRTGRVTAVRYFRGEYLDARHAECHVRNEQLWVDFADAATGPADPRQADQRRDRPADRLQIEGRRRGRGRRALWDDQVRLADGRADAGGDGEGGIRESRGQSERRENDSIAQWSRFATLRRSVTLSSRFCEASRID